MDSIGLWQIVESGPSRLVAAELEAERDLETWIERDPALLEQGLVIVGRQIRLEAGPLDLLAIDPQGRWVLIEIKRERLRREVIAQAIDYASCLSRLDPAWLRSQCDAYLRTRNTGAVLDEILEQRGGSVGNEEDGREVIIYLVGAGYDPGLERMVGYLSDRAELSVRMVTFSVFKDAQDRLVLARDIHESAEEPAVVTGRARATSLSADTVLALADRNGVGGVMRPVHRAAADLGLWVRPYSNSIMVAPPENRARCLVYVPATPPKSL